MATQLEATQVEDISLIDCDTDHETFRATSVVSRSQQQDDVLNVPDPWKLGYDWPIVIWIAVVHLGALAAPFFFTWKALGLCAILAWFTGSLGVCMGYHRYLTHGSFVTYRPVRWLLALLGGMAGGGSAPPRGAHHSQHPPPTDHEG